MWCSTVGVFFVLLANFRTLPTSCHAAVLYPAASPGDIRYPFSARRHIRSDEPQQLPQHPRTTDNVDILGCTIAAYFGLPPKADHCQRLFSAIKQEAAAIAAADKKMQIRDQQLQLQQLEAGYPELDDLMRLIRMRPPTTAEELPSLLEQNPLMMASSFGDSGGHQAQKKSKLKILRL